MNNFEKQIYFRAHRRGVKELDILLGKFVEYNLNNLSYEDSMLLLKLLDCDDKILLEALKSFGKEREVFINYNILDLLPLWLKILNITMIV